MFEVQFDIWIAGAVDVIHLNSSTLLRKVQLMPIVLAILHNEHGSGNQSQFECRRCWTVTIVRIKFLDSDSTIISVIIIVNSCNNFKLSQLFTVTSCDPCRRRQINGMNEYFNKYFCNWKVNLMHYFRSSLIIEFLSMRATRMQFFILNFQWEGFQVSNSSLEYFYLFNARKNRR